MSAINFSRDEINRLNELNAYSILNTAIEADFDNIAHLVAQICEVPIATITLIDEKREWFKSCIGLNNRESDRDTAFCARAILSDKPLIIEDALKDPEFRNNPMVIGSPHLRFYAGVPLISPNGYALGTLAIKDTKPRKLSALHLQALTTLAAQVMVLLERHRQNHALDQLNQDFALKAKELEKKSEFLSALLENLSEGIVACDETGKLSLFNHATRELHGLNESPLSPERWAANSVDELLKQADLAMYQAKAAGKNTYRFYHGAMQTAMSERVTLEEDLRQALLHQQFLLHYQPQLNSHGEIEGAEALIRWIHPERGTVSPAQFIPIAEETKLILPIGEWVLRTACQQLAIWSQFTNTAPLVIAVNVSIHQFRQQHFVDQVLHIVQETGANPHRIKLELTESLLVDNVDDVIDKISALKEKGIQFSLDDFGTGYSSLSYLKRLPLDQLKIDQSFMRDILVDPNDASIARAIITLAQNLGLSVIAEGVETEEQRQFLFENNCLSYQGYLFSRPLPIHLFEHYVMTKTIMKT